MSQMLDKFRICDKIPSDMRTAVKVFHVFFIYGQNVLFVTDDDKVFGCGEYFSHIMDDKISELRVLTELCYKNINQFFFGWNFIIALSDDNRVFSFGCNENGQLGRNQEEFLNDIEPGEISALRDKNIRDISCGDYHALALTIDGRVFAWGNNTHGQIGCGWQDGMRVTDPVEIQFFTSIKVISVHCDKDFSAALGFNRSVYIWGAITATDKISEPIVLENINNVELISLDITDHLSTIICLTKSGKVHFNNMETIHEPFQQLKIGDHEVKELYKNYLVTKDYLIMVNANGGVTKLKNETIFNYLDYTHKSIEVANYERNIFRKIIGHGDFSSVTEYEQHYKKIAVKKIKLDKIKESTMDFSFLKKLNTDFVVDVHVVYQEYHNFTDFLFIKMDLCDESLESILDKMKSNEFHSVIMAKPEFKAGEFVFLLSMEILYEILECVNYIHSQKPPIIHRNLKASNILVKYNCSSARFVKLVDFGLKVVKPGEIKHSVSSVAFTTQRLVFLSSTEKVDISALGRIGKRLLSVSNFKQMSINNLLVRMTHKELSVRPNTSQAMVLVHNYLNKVRILDIEWIRKFENDLDYSKFEFFKLFITRKVLSNPNRFVPIKKKREYVCPLTYCLQRSFSV